MADPSGLTQESIFEFFLSALDYIQDEEPFWNRQQGRDHIFTFTHDYGACFTYVEEDTMKPERLQVGRPCAHVQVTPLLTPSV